MTVFHRVGKRLNTVGGDYTFQADALEQRWRRAVRRKLALFGSGGGREPDGALPDRPAARAAGPARGESPACARERDRS